MSNQKDKIKQILMDAAKQVLEEYGVALHNVNFEVLDITDSDSEGVLINDVWYNDQINNLGNNIEQTEKEIETDWTPDKALENDVVLYKLYRSFKRDGNMESFYNFLRSSYREELADKFIRYESQKCQSSD